MCVQKRVHEKQKSARTNVPTLFPLVRKMGLEPTRHRHTHLKRACLPIPALPLIAVTARDIITQFTPKSQAFCESFIGIHSTIHTNTAAPAEIPLPGRRCVYGRIKRIAVLGVTRGTPRGAGRWWHTSPWPLPASCRLPRRRGGRR